ncbi:indigoidine synthase A-like protein, partial [Oesophagostomum dentatum]
KSILDIPKTVEYLVCSFNKFLLIYTWSYIWSRFKETNSVNCIVYGPRNVFPGFFTQETSMRGQFNTCSLEEVAQVIGLPAGTVLACPIPKEFQGDGKAIEDAIQRKILCREKGIISKDVTPFILAYLNKMTSGASMKTNIALLKNNAKIAAQLANLLAKTGNNKRSKDVVYAQPTKGKLGCDVSFISMIGNDDNGKYFLDHCSHIDPSHVEIVEDLPTATYMSVNVRGEVRFGISSIGEIVNRITPEVISRNEDIISKADHILFDGNIPVDTIGKIVELSSFYKKKAWFEPTDLFKARKIFDCKGMDKIQFISPNANEFRQIVERSGLHIEADILLSPSRVCEFICAHPQVMHNLDTIIVTLSSHGIAVVSRYKLL